MRVADAGADATGTLGSHVVDAVRTAGHEAVAISRGAGAGLFSGTGLVEVLRGASAVIDASAPHT